MIVNLLLAVLGTLCVLGAIARYIEWQNNQAAKKALERQNGESGEH